MITTTQRGSDTRKVLLLVDFQEGFLTNETRSLREPLQELVLDPSFSLVVATRFHNEEDSLWSRVMHWNGLSTEEQQRLAVELPRNALVIDKTSYGFAPETLCDLLPTLQDAQVFIAGIETDVCVTIIAASLFDAGIVPTILAGYTGSNRGKRHNLHALITLRRIVGRDNVVINYALTGRAQLQCTT